ncbi:MAG: HEAT repeat domain-containing protein [Saprospiraceae bacterium]
MNKETAKILIQKFQEASLTDSENELLETYIENGWIELEELEDLNAIHKNLTLDESEIPSKEMQSVFYQNLAKEKDAVANSAALKTSWWNSLFPQSIAKTNWGFGIMTLLIGLFLGNFFQSGSTEQIDAIASQLQKTQETMMMALLEKESSRDRLKAVKISNEMTDVSGPVVEALLRTLNNDENVNVRLAAIEALADFSQNPKVRKGLIDAIQYQDSPMVQLTLAELMVFLQDKKSVEEFKSLMKKKDIPTEVKNQLEEKIKVLL